MKHIVKRLRAAILIAAVALVAAMFIGCSPSLDRPTKLTLNQTTLMLSWTPIQYATAYVVDVDGKQYASSTTSFSLAFLTEGDHTVRVKARDAKNEHGDSSWSAPLTFHKEYESGMVYTLTNANTEYEVTRVGTARGDIVIEDEYRGKPVTGIAARAFYASGAVTSVKIGKNVKRIGDFAFANCSNITEVEFPAGMTHIGANAFQGCRGLTAVALPGELTAVSDYTFRYCRNITAITFGDKIESIGVSAFSDCDKLAAVALPESVKTVADSAFYSCDRLESVGLGGAVTIGKSAFGDCVKLAKVSGGKIETLGASAFSNCDGLTEFTFGNTVKTIGKDAFSNCNELASVVIGDSVTKIGDGAFRGTAMFKQNVSDGVIYADKWVIDCDKSITELKFRAGTVGIADGALDESNIGEADIPDSVKYIGDEAFKLCTSLRTLDVGNGVTHIGRYAFAYCKILGRGFVSLGTNVKKIDSYAFMGCTDFGDPAYTQDYPITIPDTVTEIGTRTFQNTKFWNSVEKGLIYIDDWVVGYKDDEENANITIKSGTHGISNYAFYKSASLATVYIPETVTMIGASAFAECPELALVDIDAFSDLSEIGDYAFYKCARLRDVHMPATIERIGRSAFYKSGLMSVLLPVGVKEIAPYAYYGCSTLIDLRFEDGSELETIGDYAFAGCDNLPAVELPDGLETIGDRAFNKCAKLASVRFPSSLKQIGAFAFNQCSALAAAELPDSLTEIGDKAFYKCESLASVRFGAQTKKIGAFAFYNCGLTSLDIPETVDEIGDYAFRNCKKLTAVTLRSTITYVGEHVFNGCRELTVYVDSEKDGEAWSPRWNSGYRPVVYNCTFDESGKYVTAFVKTADGIANPAAKNGVSAPTRDGYDFGGWTATIDGVERTFAMTELDSVPDGTTLTAVWTVAEDKGDGDKGDESDGGEDKDDFGGSYEDVM